jgi:predicted DCC family thiol-disulfide oxidoreductase YuxK
MDTALMIFDGDCAFCSSSARVLRKMTKGRIPIEPYQRLDLDKYGLAPELTSKAVYYCSGTATFVAAEAIARFLIDSKTIWAAAGRLLLVPGIRWLARIVYYWVARNRYRLPGGTPECQIR